MSKIEIETNPTAFELLRALRPAMELLLRQHGLKEPPSQSYRAVKLYEALKKNDNLNLEGLHAKTACGMFLSVRETARLLESVERDGFLNWPMDLPPKGHPFWNPDIGEMLDHIPEFYDALQADLETGSHNQNNIAAEEFSKKHPSLLQWYQKLMALTHPLEWDPEEKDPGLEKYCVATRKLDPGEKVDAAEIHPHMPER